MTNYNPKTKQPFATNTVVNTKPNETNDSTTYKEEKTTPTLPACIVSYKSDKQNKENQAAQIANNNNNNNKPTSAKVTPTLTAFTSSANKSEKQSIDNQSTQNTSKPTTVKIAQVTPTLVKTSTNNNNNDLCNTTFSVTTPTATKQTLEEDASNQNMNLNKQLLKQELTEPRAEQKYRPPGSSTPQPLSDSKTKQATLGHSGNQTNIVKKTLAKMTAAFKQRNNNEHLTLKNKLSSENKKQNKPGNEPFRVDSHQLQRKKSNEMFGNRALSPESDHESSNRRASSVPRTLREKQALGIVVLKSIEDSNQKKRVTRDDSSRAMTPAAMSKSEHKSLKTKVGPPPTILSLGEKIQNFFASHHKTSNQATIINNNNKIKQQTNTNSFKLHKSSNLKSISFK